MDISALTGFGFKCALHLSRADAHIELDPVRAERLVVEVTWLNFVFEVTWLTRRVLGTSIRSHARWGQRRDHSIGKATQAVNQSTRKRIKEVLTYKCCRHKVTHIQYSIGTVHLYVPLVYPQSYIP